MVRSSFARLAACASAGHSSRVHKPRIRMGRPPARSTPSSRAGLWPEVASRVKQDRALRGLPAMQPRTKTPEPPKGDGRASGEAARGADGVGSPVVNDNAGFVGGVILSERNFDVRQAHTGSVFYGKTADPLAEAEAALKKLRRNPNDKEA